MNDDGCMVKGCIFKEDRSMWRLVGKDGLT